MLLLFYVRKIKNQININISQLIVSESCLSIFRFVEFISLELNNAHGIISSFFIVLLAWRSYSAMQKGFDREIMPQHFMYTYLLKYSYLYTYSIRRCIKFCICWEKISKLKR